MKVDQGLLAIGEGISGRSIRNLMRDAVVGILAGLLSSVAVYVINVPFMVNLADGRFDDPGSLKQRYLAAMDGVTADNTVCMCGSGVTACHDLLAMEIAGLPGGRLYVGSWSAWCSDPARPVETGD